MAIEDDLYRAVSAAEFRDNTPKDQRWIRTRHQPPKGSSAFGPVQITKKKAVDYSKRGKLSPEGMTFVEQMLPIWNQMLKVGGLPNAGEFDYGGTGNFPKEQRDEYESLGKEMLGVDFNRAGGDLDKMLEFWRGKPKLEDPAYFKAATTEFWKKKSFDPEGVGYDYQAAMKAGLKRDKTGHWASLDPKTGQLLKGINHPTINKTIAEEERLGNRIIQRDGRYYSVPKG